MYATVGEDSLFDDVIKTTVAKYDPDTEMVLHFACAQDRFCTVRLRSRNGRGPESVWAERMIKNRKE
jgi:hypothetical protein